MFIIIDDRSELKVAIQKGDTGQHTGGGNDVRATDSVASQNADSSGVMLRIRPTKHHIVRFAQFLALTMRFQINNKSPIDRTHLNSNFNFTKTLVPPVAALSVSLAERRWLIWPDPPKGHSIRPRSAQSCWRECVASPAQRDAR